jgi:hypothetical protein
MMPYDAIEKFEVGISFRALLWQYSLFAWVLDFFADFFALTSFC